MPEAPQKPIELVLTARFHPRQLGQLLKRVRKAVGVSQVELAQRLKVPYQNISRLEQGTREGMISTVNRYVRALGWELVLVARPRRHPGKPGTKRKAGVRHEEPGQHAAAGDG